MANFSSPLLQATVSTSFKTTGNLYAPASAARRIMLYEVEMGQTGALSSTDCQCEWDLSRFSATAIMTASLVTPQVNDEADAAAVSQFTNNNTAEVTYTTAGNGLNLKHWAINQRGSYRWRALDDGDHIGIAATAQKGLGLRILSSNFTGSAIGALNYLER
jgi:hypothetical protein